jgi:dUTP pyrophosphatase
MANELTLTSSGASVVELLREKYVSYMHLKVYLGGDVGVSTVDSVEMKEIYAKAIKKHNERLLTDDFMDAGFDVYCPTQFAIVSEKVNKVDFGLKCSASMVHHLPGLSTEGGERRQSTGFYMYPRSSLSKTPLRLANSVGIIDAGYRGNLIGMFDYKERSVLTGGDLDQGWYLVERGDRLVQICAPGLVPIFVEMVGNVEELSRREPRFPFKPS